MKSLRLCFHHICLFAWRHPFEFFLTVLMIWSLVNSFIRCPTFWAPAVFVEVRDIPNDISLCHSNSDSSDRLPRCPLIIADKDPNVILNLVASNDSIETSHTKFGILNGGSFNPSSCSAVHQAIVILPYRNRETQLKVFLQNIHPFLIHQSINYTIVVVEQTDELPFNRAKLFNVGFVEMMKINSDCCCFIFHDVDLIPELSHNMYTCSKNPRHMSPFVNTLRYNLMYKGLFGGVIAIKRAQFKSINGFSNLFYGWGGEDDDLSARITKAGLEIIRWPYSVSRYYMLHHKKEKPGGEKDLLLDTADARASQDGLSTLEYKVVSITEEPLFTRIKVKFS